MGVIQVRSVGVLTRLTPWTNLFDRHSISLPFQSIQRLCLFAWLQFPDVKSIYEVRLMKSLRKLLEMIRFSHTIFALPFALLAAVMAWVASAPADFKIGFSWLHLIGILICMVGARQRGNGF